MAVIELVVRCLLFAGWNSVAFQAAIALGYSVIFGQKMLPFPFYGWLFDLLLFHLVATILIEERVRRRLQRRGLENASVVSWLIMALVVYVLAALSIALWQNFGIFVADIAMLALLVPANIGRLLRLFLTMGTSTNRRLRDWVWVTRGAVIAANLSFLEEFVEPLRGKPPMSIYQMAHLSIGVTLVTVLALVGVVSLRRQPGFESVRNKIMSLGAVRRK